MMTKQINSMLKSVVFDAVYPLHSLSVAAFREGAITYEGQFGRNPALNADTKFRVASVSKLVATIGVMQLVEAGKLALDRDISDYFGFPIRNPHFPHTPITLRMLLSHTSSIRDGGERYSLPIPFTMRDFFDPQGAAYANGTHWGTANEPPDTYFYYANLNFGMVGTLLEIGSGKRFDRYMQRHVFEPLGIEASYNVRTLSDDAFNNLAPLYRKQNANGG